MWPRTAEERARGRNTGFVCFMVREDAQDAIDAFQDQDPLECGRRMCLRWGKNVKKTVKRGTGGVPIPPIRKKDKKPKKDVVQEDVNGNETRKVDDNSSDVAPSNNDLGQSSIAAKFQISTTIHKSKVTITAPMPAAQQTPSLKYNAEVHAADAIRVVLPFDPYRLKFITTVGRLTIRIVLIKSQYFLSLTFFILIGGTLDDTPTAMNGYTTSRWISKLCC